MKRIDLSGNTLTNGFKEALDIDHLVYYPFLKDLYIEGTQLSTGDITAICSAVRSGKFPKLKSFSLKHIFAAAVPQELLCLETLLLNNMKLGRQDLITIHEAVACCKLPNLEILNLSDNILSDYVRFLLGDTDNVIYHSLRVLQVKNTRLRESDLLVFSKAFREEKLPILEELDISNNTLTKNLRGLLGSINQHFTLLDLTETHLASTDVKHLCSAITGKKFLKLQILSLCCNFLTNHISEMLCTTKEVVLPCLRELWLINTALNKNDVAGLSESVKSGKLPKLVSLHLQQNNLNCRQELVDLGVQIYIGQMSEEGELNLGNKVSYQSLWRTRFPQRKLMLYLDIKDVIHPEHLETLQSADCCGSTVLIKKMEFERIV